MNKIKEPQNICLIILIFSLKGLVILQQEKRGQVNTTETERFNSIFYKPEPANKQHTNQSVLI